MSLKTLFNTLIISGAVLTAALSHGQNSHHHAHTDSEHEPVVQRTIEIRMDDDMRFSPQTIVAQQGERVRLSVINAGKIPHELVLGPPHELLEHAQLMRANTDMAHHHSANAITLNAGERGEILWTFKRSGTLDFACLIPGHYEAGMKGNIRIN